jgi:hypothetical protein
MKQWVTLPGQTRNPVHRLPWPSRTKRVVYFEHSRPVRRRETLVSAQNPFLSPRPCVAVSAKSRGAIGAFLPVHGDYLRPVDARQSGPRTRLWLT